jgi:hypothetical protein
MMKLPSMNFLSTAFLQVWQRFPLSMIAACLGTYAMFCSLNLEADKHHFHLLRLFMAALVALPLVTGVTVWVESRKISLPIHLILQAIVGGMAVFFYFYMDDSSKDFQYVRIPRYLIAVAIGHLWVSFAPFLKNESVSDFWEYNKQLFGNFFVGAAYSVIIFTGLAVAHLAVDQLFNLNLSRDNYAKLYFITAGIFNTTYFLYHFPKDYQFDRNEMAYNASFFNLCKYILVPIVGLYFLILYAYSAKIGFTWTLPQGWVSTLVIGFAAVGIFTWLISYLLPDQIAEKTIINPYRNWFWLVLFPMIGLLFVAIGRRIMDYGVTEERFLVAHTGAWLLLCCIFFVIVKSNDLKFVPMSMAAFLLVGIIGPFSAFESSKRSQTKILEQLLTKDGMMEGGKVKTGTCSEPRKVMSAIRFLESRNGLDCIQPWFDFKIDTLGNALNLSDKAYSIGSFLKIDDIEAASASTVENYFINGDMNLSAIQIAGFEEYIPINWYAGGDESVSSSSLCFNKDGITLEYLAVDSNTQKTILYLFDIQTFIKNSFVKESNDSKTEFVSKPIFDLENDAYKIRILVNYANFTNKQGVYHFQNFQGVAFLKKK